MKENNNSRMDFLIDKERRSISAIKKFSANLPLVWKAYTQKELLDQWWAPKPWKAQTKTMDFKKGGKWHYAMLGPNGEQHWGLVIYGEIEPLRRFTGIDAFTDADANVNLDLPQSKWDVLFMEEGEGARVDFTSFFSDVKQMDTILEMGVEEGMRIAMEGLDTLLATLANSPDA